MPPVPGETRSGPGRLLVGVYGVLALAATARAGYQLATHGSEAPLAYALSLFAGVVYVVATVALWRGGAWRPVAWAACSVELVGVLAVGTASLVDPDAFPDATVWSGFGQGYGYVPLVLPFVGLWWLWHTRPAPVARDTQEDA
ncbi:hypothetical protein [Luteimicrobium subarcticum]|uniref:Integral membrane protein n=1 Tax=Luteimicrobium subarcticum TaxID=620910 RepID=A0A2M8WRA2_9MICO|nr:hypothetical protein [Luteimicrobium subarcticum]PJI93471.1 hypothetical protein CLV34_2045 [Luteimicrobium subarcticum]